MQFYCGIDLGATHSHLCVIDENLTIHLQKKAPNNLAIILLLLEPYRESLHVLVESTFNWYWIVDGLADAGIDVKLAHTLGLFMITGAKVKTDRRDAHALAKLLRIGAAPLAYIYPKDTRPLRDLLRRRNSLVNARAAEYGSIRTLLLRHGILSYGRKDVKAANDEQLSQLFDHPFVKIHATQQIERIDLFSRQIDSLEKSIIEKTQPLDAFTRLKTLPGLGTILALTVYYESGEIHRFPDARHYSSYCRLVPGIAQSGSSSRRGRGSKQGNPYLKWAYSQAAIHAVRYYPKIKQCYQKHLERHRGRARKLIAYNVIAHKLAVAAFHILSKKTAYKEEMLFGS